MGVAQSPQWVPIQLEVAEKIESRRDLISRRRLTNDYGADRMPPTSLWASLPHITKEHRSKGQTLKPPGSTRRIALHQAVIDEGFLRYVASLPPGPLFPGVKLNRF